MQKKREDALRILPDAERGYPYEGSRMKMLIVDDVKNTELMSKVLQAMYEELLAPKSKMKKGKKQ